MAFRSNGRGATSVRRRIKPPKARIHHGYTTLLIKLHEQNACLLERSIRLVVNVTLFFKRLPRVAANTARWNDHQRRRTRDRTRVNLYADNSPPPSGGKFLLAESRLHGIPIYHRRNALHNLVTRRTRLRFSTPSSPPFIRSTIRDFPAKRSLSSGDIAAIQEKIRFERELCDFFSLADL